MTERNSKRARPGQPNRTCGKLSLTGNVTAHAPWKRREQESPERPGGDRASEAARDSNSDAPEKALFGRGSRRRKRIESSNDRLASNEPSRKTAMLPADEENSMRRERSRRARRMRLYEPDRVSASRMIAARLRASHEQIGRGSLKASGKWRALRKRAGAQSDRLRFAEPPGGGNRRRPAT